MPAKSIAPSAPSIPWVKYDAFSSYKAEAGHFKTVLSSDKENPLEQKSIRVFPAAVRNRATFKLGDKEYVSQDFDSFQNDILQLKDSEDYRAAPAYVGTVAELFGKYDKVKGAWSGGSAGADVKFSRVFSAISESGSKLKLELTSATAKRAWANAVKESKLDASWVLVFTAKDETVKVGEGKKTKIVHEMDVQDGGELSDALKAKVDELNAEVIAESVKLQERLRSERFADVAANAVPAPGSEGNKNAAAAPAGEPIKSEDIPF
jgi:hypothetical protein